jgi:hypothetical protein
MKFASCHYLSGKVIVDLPNFRQFGFKKHPAGLDTESLSGFIFVHVRVLDVVDSDRPFDHIFFVQISKVHFHYSGV